MNHTFWLRSIRVVLAAVLVFCVGGAASVAAYQSGDVWTELGENFAGTSSGTETSTITGDTYVLPSSGAEVVIAEGYAPEESDFEDQLIINTPQGMGAIGAVQGFGTPQSVMETYANAFGEELDGAEQIDAQGNREFASGLYSIDFLGVNMYMFITVDAVSTPGFHTIQVAIAEADIAAAITTFRGIISIDGQPMFAGIDEAEIQEMIDQYRG